MIDHETIGFELHLSADYWQLPPLVEIAVDGVVHHQAPITDRRERPGVICFEHRLRFGDPHELVINRLGKSDDQFMITSQGTVLDQLLLIDRVVIDGVNIRDIVWTRSWFEPCYPEPWASEQRHQGLELPARIPGETVFGHNGRWVLPFTSPFYQFLIASTDS